MRPRAGFGVILHAEGTNIANAHSLVGLIVEIGVSDVSDAAQRSRVYTEIVILACDLD